MALGCRIPVSPITLLLNDLSMLDLSVTRRRWLLAGLTAAKKKGCSEVESPSPSPQGTLNFIGRDKNAHFRVHGFWRRLHSAHSTFFANVRNGSVRLIPGNNPKFPETRWTLPFRTLAETVPCADIDIRLGSAGLGRASCPNLS